MTTATTATRPADIAALECRVADLEARFSQPEPTDSMSIVVFSGELDKLMAAMVIATGAAACGTPVSLFFTFWATPALKKNGPQAKGKSLVERAFGWMLPGGLNNRKLSNLDMLGLGRRLMSFEMAKKNVATLPELLENAAALGVQISICEMSMQLMGIQRSEMIDYPDLSYCGVAQFVEQSAESKTTLFI